MKKIKSAIAILLTVSLLSLSGCSAITSLLNNLDKGDFYELSKVAEIAQCYQSIDISGNKILFLTYADTEPYKLIIYDTEADKITAQKLLEDDEIDLDYIVGASFYNENQVVVYDDEDKDNDILFDLNLNKVGKVNYPFNYGTSEENASSLTSTMFNRYDTFSERYIESINTTICVFDDEPQTVYTLYNSNYASPIDCHNNTLFVTTSDDTCNLNISIDDYKNSTRINEKTIENTNNAIYSFVSSAKLSDNFVLLILTETNENTGGYVTKPYLWKYNENPTNTKLDISKLSESDFENKYNEKVNALNDKYGIEILLNEYPELYSNGYTFETDATIIDTYFILQTLENTLALFPDGFIKEIYSDVSKTLKIYFVSYISEVSAFASTIYSDYPDELADESLIVFSETSFDESVIFHEFAHLIETKIVKYYDEVKQEDYYQTWNLLNKENYCYGCDDYDEEYFVSIYATTNELEDFAETFQQLYRSVAWDDASLLDYSVVMEKAKFLCNSIREVFDTAKNSKSIYWEECVKF